MDTQRHFNDALVNKSIGEMLQKLSGGQAPIGATALNNMLMQLRKNCNHPDLISGGLDGRGLHSSTSHLNLSQFWSLKPKLASTSQLDLSLFRHLNTQPSQPKVLRQTENWRCVAHKRCLR